MVSFKDIIIIMISNVGIGVVEVNVGFGVVCEGVIKFVLG